MSTGYQQSAKERECRCTTHNTNSIILWASPRAYARKSSRQKQAAGHEAVICFYQVNLIARRKLGPLNVETRQSRCDVGKPTFCHCHRWRRKRTHIIPGMGSVRALRECCAIEPVGVVWRKQTFEASVSVTWDSKRKRVNAYR